MVSNSLEKQSLSGTTVTNASISSDRDALGEYRITAAGNFRDDMRLALMEKEKEQVGTLTIPTFSPRQIPQSTPQNLPQATPSSTPALPTSTPTSPTSPPAGQITADMEAVLVRTAIAQRTTYAAKGYNIAASDLTPDKVRQDIRELTQAVPAWCDKFNRENGTNINPADMIQFMTLETAGTFSPTIRNRIGATGLIQLMNLPVEDMNKQFGRQYSLEGIAKMSITQQLNGPVADYFKMWVDRSRSAGRPTSLDNVGDLYLTVAAPAALGRSNGSVVYTGATAAQNPAWDGNRDGQITVGEIKQSAVVKSQQITAPYGPLDFEVARIGFRK